MSTPIVSQSSMDPPRDLSAAELRQIGQQLHWLANDLNQVLFAALAHTQLAAALGAEKAALLREQLAGIERAMQTGAALTSRLHDMGESLVRRG